MTWLPSRPSPCMQTSDHGLLLKCNNNSEILLSARTTKQPSAQQEQPHLLWWRHLDHRRMEQILRMTKHIGSCQQGKLPQFQWPFCLSAVDVRKSLSKINPGRSWQHIWLGSQGMCWSVWRRPADIFNTFLSQKSQDISLCALSQSPSPLCFEQLVKHKHYRGTIKSIMTWTGKLFLYWGSQILQHSNYH